MNLSKLEGYFNKFGLDIRRYPTLLLRNRMALLQHSNINVIFDVGANVGQYAMQMRQIGYSERIVSFEPIIAPYELLLQQVRKDSLWECSQVALGDFKGESTINVSGNVASSSILEITKAHTDEVPKTRTVSTENIVVDKLDNIIDEYVNQDDRLFVKIDTQGFEKKVIEGSLNSIKRISGFQLELSLVEMYQGEALFEEMIQYMKAFGYEIFSMEPGFCNSDSGRLYQCDVIFFKSQDIKFE